MTETIPQPDRQQAAVARRASASEVGYHRSRPASPATVNAPCGSARSLPFPAKLRAKMVRRNGEDRYHLNGIASVTDTPYEMWDMFGPYDEIVAHEAFTDTLAADPDVAFLVNHRGVTMARRKPGLDDAAQSLLLGMVEDGLNTDAWVNPKRQDVSDLVVAIDDGDIDQMSFAFMLEEGWWNDDFTIFKITKLDIDRGDVSAVNYGANPYTSIAARSREIFADVDRLPAGAARALYARLSERDDLRTPVTPHSDGAPQTRAPLTMPDQRATNGSLAEIDAWLATVQARST